VVGVSSKTRKMYKAFGKGIVDAQIDEKKKLAEIQGEGLKNYFEIKGGFDKLATFLGGVGDFFRNLGGNIINSLLGGPAQARTSGSGASYLTDGSAEGNKKAILAAIKDGGFNDRSASNMLAQIEGESGFQMVAEQSYKNTSVADIRRIFGGVPEYSDAQIEELKKDDKTFFDAMYGNYMGNAADEGYKYRGRGFIQITGKDNYKKIGDIIGEDLVGNPDLLNDPGIAAKATMAYFKMVGANNDNMSTMKGAYNAVFRGNPNDQREDAQDRKRITKRGNRANTFLSQIQSGALAPAANVSAGVSSKEGTGMATFGETDGGSGRLVNNTVGGVKYVHGHFQTNTGTRQDVINDTAAMVRGMLNTGLTDIYLADDQKFLPSMSDGEIKGLVEQGLALHSHSGDGRSVDIFVPKGTPVPFPITDVMNAGNAGRTGMIPGSGHTWVGHLTPDSQAGSRNVAAGISQEPDASPAKMLTAAKMPALAASSASPQTGTPLMASSQQVAMATFPTTGGAPTIVNNYYGGGGNQDGTPVPNGVSAGIGMDRTGTEMFQDLRIRSLA